MSHRWGHAEWGHGKPRQRTSANYWAAPLKWDEEAGRLKTRAKVFCASMADIFDDEIPVPWRRDVFELISVCGNLDWLLLTKRPQNIPAMLPAKWGKGWDNVWLGTSTENQRRADERLPLLRAIPAVVRFLSVEPLLEPVKLDLRGISWVICGGESGPGFRPMDPAWAADVRDQCIAAKVAFFFKQFSGRSPKQLGRKLEGKEWHLFPRPRVSV